MSDKCIFITQTDGSVHVVHPAPEMFDPESRTRQDLASRGVLVDADDNMVMAFIASENVPPDLEYRFGTTAEIPADRTFRNAWKDGNGIEIDMPKAREIHMERLRNERNQKLKEADVEFMKAVESGDSKKVQDVSAKKQTLRDMTANIDFSGINTPEELKNFVPKELK